MPKRGSRDWLSRAAWGLMSGALALSVLTAGGGGASMPGARSALADEIDCYNDKDLYNLPECVERRALDKKNGMSQNEAQGATGTNTDQSGGGQQQASGGQQQSSGSGQQQSGGGQQQSGGGQQASSGDQGSGGQQQATGGNQQPAGGGQQQPAASSSGGGDEDKPEVRGPLTDPKQVVLTLEDAGKEATQYLSEEGSDKYGPWARTRYERDRSDGKSALGPNVMDSKAWVAKDVDSAKTLFKEQAAIKNFPERKETVNGPVEKIKPTSYGDDFDYTAGYFQDDSKVWQHYRFVMRVGNVVSVVYLFGREDFFQDQKDRTWTGQGDWFTAKVFHRM